MPARSSHITALRYPRPERPQRRARRWPWLIILALLIAVAYVTLRQRTGPSPLPPLAHPRIGIIAGHWQSDSGATCPDGLREVDINTAVARQVVERLRAQGYDAEVLAEYDDRLQGYAASALVSLHADSCMFALSGYKAVGSSRGPAAAKSAQLASALTASFAVATGLGFHADTITPDMTNYHAFHRVHPETPAAILEMGFMSDDRDLLVGQPERLAAGIVDGIVAFLRAQAGPLTPTARGG